MKQKKSRNTIVGKSRAHTTIQSTLERGPEVVNPANKGKVWLSKVKFNSLITEEGFCRQPAYAVHEVLMVLPSNVNIHVF